MKKEAHDHPVYIPHKNRISRHQITNPISTSPAATSSSKMAHPNTATLDIFTTAQTLCVHHSAKILSDHGYFNFLARNALYATEAAALVWSKIVENDAEQRNFWENAAFEIRSALASGVITTAHISITYGLPWRTAEYDEWATKASEKLIAVTRAESLAASRAEAVAEEEREAEVEERKKAAWLEQARYYKSREGHSPVSPIDPMDLAMLDFDGPEPSIGRPSPMSPFRLDEEEEEAAAVSPIDPMDLAMLDLDGPEPSIGRPSPMPAFWLDEEEEEAAAAAPYLDLDSLAPLVEVATAERLTPVKARIVDC
jgi:hypothetical protein